MSWNTDSIEYEPSRTENLFEGDLTIRPVDDLIFYGRVFDENKGEPVPEALVKAFVRYKDGREEPLCHCLCGEDGYYLLQVKKALIQDDIAGIILRAGITIHFSPVNVEPVTLSKPLIAEKDQEIAETDFTQQSSERTEVKPEPEITNASREKKHVRRPLQFVRFGEWI